MEAFMTITKSKRIWIFVNVLLILIWCVVIFYLSSRTASQSTSQSRSITEMLIRLIDKLDGKISTDFELNRQINYFNHILRDVAHSFCYLVLSLLTVNLLYLLRIRNWKALFYTIIFCIIYSLSDEIHQIFVPGRAFQIIDLTNDALGAIIGIIFYKCIKRITLKNT